MTENELTSDTSEQESNAIEHEWKARGARISVLVGHPRDVFGAAMTMTLALFAAAPLFSPSSLV